MVFSSIEDFYRQAENCSRLSRQEEIACAKAMKNGDDAAREKLIQSYIPMAAGHVKHLKPDFQTFGCVLYCVQALEKAVDSFDFLQESETFSHRLSWWLREVSVQYIVRKTP